MGLVVRYGIDFQQKPIKFSHQSPHRIKTKEVREYAKSGRVGKQDIWNNDRGSPNERRVQACGTRLHDYGEETVRSSQLGKVCSTKNNSGGSITWQETGMSI